MKERMSKNHGESWFTVSFRVKFISYHQFPLRNRLGSFVKSILTNSVFGLDSIFPNQLQLYIKIQNNK